MGGTHGNMEGERKRKGRGRVKGREEVDTGKRHRGEA